MKQRFEQAWEACIKEYREGRVLTERTLQALLFRELSGFPEELIVCEPRLEGNGLGPFIPDIVVAREHEIVAICELKFVPQGFPIFEKDLSKLQHYAQSKLAHRLLLDPVSGTYAEEAFYVSGDCLLVFAVIGRRDSTAVCIDTLSSKMLSVDVRFLHLVLGVGQ